jgi:hypothetical protein
MTKSLILAALIAGVFATSAIAAPRAHIAHHARHGHTHHVHKTSHHPGTHHGR